MSKPTDRPSKNNPPVQARNPLLAKYTNRRYLDALEERVIIFDGAMGTNLQAMRLTAEHFGGEQYMGCSDYLVITHPKAVEQVHRSFLEVGVDVIETNTFRANRITLDEYHLADQVLEINQAAASLARRLADEYSQKSGQPRFVAGAIGPTGKLPSANDPELSDITFDELADVFRQQAVGLIRGVVDLLLIETSQDILEVKAAIHGILEAFEQTGVRLPIQAQVTLDTTGRMLLGTDPAAALTILEGLPIDVIGLNCSTGPEHMRQPIEFLGENATLPVSCIPNAGLPLNVDGEAVYPLKPESFAREMAEFIERHNVGVVGGCCGTTPAHLARLVELIYGQKQPSRPAHGVPRLASGIHAIPMRQDPPPLLIGERCNAQGSRKFKRLLLAEDYDTILTVARDQVENGAHALDISVAVTERADEARLMHNVIRKLVVSGIDVPLVIDTTEPQVMEVALKVAPGRCLLNSTHLESGRAKTDKVFALAKKFNAAVMLLTIDENGMAKTTDRKVQIAKRLYHIAVEEHGLRPRDLVFDALTFSLATGDPEYANAAVETLDAIGRIKEELPGTFTSLGVSNLSFGLSRHARPVLNSVFLYHCVQAGLDMAIVNPAHITPYSEISQEERKLAEDLIFNRQPDALQRYIDHFENVDPQTIAKELTDPTAGMPPEERLHWRIVHRYKENVEEDIDELIANLTSTPTPTPSPKGGGESPPLPRGEGLGVREEKEHTLHSQPPLPKSLLHRARELRKNATSAEQLLWQLLHNRSLHNAKFRRQHPIKGYILDFYCHEAKLAIELDSSQHLEPAQAHHDHQRPQVLAKEGIRVIRFWNSDVLQNTEEVLNEIWLALDEALAPDLPLKGEEEQSPPPERDARSDDNQSPSPQGRGVRGEDQNLFLTQHAAAIHILNNVLLPAMKEVGDKFGTGELILPFVLQSAEVMKKAVAHLETYLERQAGTSKGRVVLATVYGDVHDIGKNLVKTILANNGYQIIDLGKQVPAETIIQTAVEQQANAIGLSALLVSTSKQMPLIVNQLHRRGLQIPVLIGGAAINRRFGRRILLTEDDQLYAAGVFYCKDAFEGLKVIESLTDPQKRPVLIHRIHAEAEQELGRVARPQKSSRPKRSTVKPLPPEQIPTPPVYGPHIVHEMPLEIVFQYLAKNELFRLSWGAKNARGEEWEKLKVEFEEHLARMQKETLREGWLKPQGVYGYWPCQSDGDDLITYDLATVETQHCRVPTEIARFTFPRQPAGDHLCLADYFAPKDSGAMDVVAFQVVTVGAEATERFDALQEASNYSEAYYFHGLAVQTAEAAAEYLHRHIRRELGLPEDRGKRYSWGYPAIPDLEDHRKVFNLLPVEAELGMSLTSAFQLIPEQSTAAIIVHHPEAKYFNVGQSRIEQLTK